MLKSVAIMALAFLSAGCQLQLAVDVAISPGGAGTLELAVGLDEELLELLTDAGFDPTLGLDELDESAPDWRVEQIEGDDGLTLAFETEFDDPDDFDRVLEDFRRAGGARDAALFDQLDISVQEDGAVVFSGRAGLRLPESAGAEGAGVEFDGEDLAALMEERGDEFVRYDLRVTLPAEPVSHDGDAREGNSVTWDLPVGEFRAVEARSAPIPDRTWLLVAAVALLAAAIGAVAVWWTRRRRHVARPRS